MNQKQKKIVATIIRVLCITFIFVTIMVNVRDALNKSEATRTMVFLGQQVHKYREKYRSSPPESFIMAQRQKIEDVRLGEMTYRAQWLGYNAKPGDILAYSEKNYGFIAGKGAIVMFLDGTVKWMDKVEFDKLLDQQQSTVERDLLRKDIGL